MTVLKMLALVSLAATATACGAHAQPGDGGGTNIVRLAFDANQQRSVRVGDTIAFDVEPVDGEVPLVQVCGLYGAATALDPARDPLPATDAVLQSVDGARATYKAVALGKVGLCGVKAQVIEQCRKRTCIDLIGDLKPMVMVTVSDK